MRQLPADPKQQLKLSLLAFAVWLAPLVLLMVLEGAHVGAALFDSSVATYAYLITHGLLTALALALGVLTLVRGPTKYRLIMVVPVIILVLYSGILIGGPG